MAITQLNRYTVHAAFAIIRESGCYSQTKINRQQQSQCHTSISTQNKQYLPLRVICLNWDTQIYSKSHQIFTSTAKYCIYLNENSSFCLLLLSKVRPSFITKTPTSLKNLLCLFDCNIALFLSKRALYCNAPVQLESILSHLFLISLSFYHLKEGSSNLLTWCLPENLHFQNIFFVFSNMPFFVKDQAKIFLTCCLLDNHCKQLIPATLSKQMTNN